MIVAIITLIVLILLNAFFAASEIALIGLNDNKVKKMADSGDKKAKLLYKLISEPSRFLSTIQIGITLAGFLASAFAADFFAEPLANALHNLGVPIAIGLLETIALIAITILLSYFTLVFGELVPKQLALHRAEVIANFAVRPLTILSKLTLPIVKLLTFSTNMVVKLFGVDPNEQSEEATEEEIRLLVDIGGERGTIRETEKLMINRIFEFNDKEVSDIVTHRTNMSALSIDTTFHDLLKRITEKGYTRFPVFEDHIDNIIGVLHVKDLFDYVQNNEKDFQLRNYIRKPFFVLESLTVDELFTVMQKNNVHIAIVLDDYGGTEGLVTIEDVIEEIVGEISSESNDAGVMEEEITKLDQDKYEINGTIHLWELGDVFDTEFPTKDFDTLSGFLIGKLGYIPSEEERPVIEYKNFVFEVAEVADNRIEKVIVQIVEEKNEKTTE
ncbi:hemolysin family protein [Oceanobacillus halophilus]|uniref:HlyC/CorC family transporter n=1 Tax=Oceanobacillus halophilus TaxID=930130 RepID=A0A494ZRZ8_9BACI|nr:hemolysin family protein [Oceanobacillus halophilus]RKQ28328.1 HlyC/CorC family transporter [Oceanobacillus halophilus]